MIAQYVNRIGHTHMQYAPSFYEVEYLPVCFQEVGR